MSTDAMYNGSSRYIHQKFVIHFPDTAALEITKNDYLVHSTLLEESCDSSDTPFGEVTANELDLELYNLNGVFNPLNTSGEYYGKIKEGVQIDAYMKPDEATDWDKVGVFFVSEWSTTAAGSIATVVAYDRLHKIFSLPVPSAPVLKGKTYVEIISDFFYRVGYTEYVTIDNSLTDLVSYSYFDYSNNKELLSDLMTGAMADCYCDHNGNIVVKGKVTSRSLRATLTDNNQLITVTIKQSIESTYDCADVTYNTLSESAETNILSTSSEAVPTGASVFTNMAFNRTPVVKVTNMSIESPTQVVPIEFIADANKITYEVFNRSSLTTSMSVNIIGAVVESVESSVRTPGINVLSISSNYIQSQERAAIIADYISDVGANYSPSIELEVRGNPLLNIGDKIIVDSNKYTLEYTGIITRISYEYDGALKSTITLQIDTTEEV